MPYDDKTNSPEELLDLVNEDDQIIGQVVRAKAHLDPTLIHREVWILLYDKKHRLLFQQRSKHKQSRPAAWAESCAGHVPAGMEPNEAAHQELREELGFDTELTFVEKYLDRRSTETRFINFYLGQYTGERLQLEPAEVEKTRLCNQKEYKQLLNNGGNFGENAQNLIERYWNGEFDRLKK